ncbi:hypothetical protein [Priestia megaterium]|uniref:hypothetical protein n=1 Tax=Priestia megaterium TaxID=1404 RepID=UPI003C2DF885
MVKGQKGKLRRGSKIPKRRRPLSSRIVLEKRSDSPLLKNKIPIALALVLSVTMTVLSFKLVKNGVIMSEALFGISFAVMTIACFLIALLVGVFKNYSHPFWILWLGLLTTFVGFTLSASFQEIMKEGEEKAKLNQKLYILAMEARLQRDGIERTLDDFRTVLFEKSKDSDKQKQFYVRKQISVYNESDAKNILLSDLDILQLNLEEKDIKTMLLLNDMGKISSIYDDLTFKSDDAEEMLQSYFELISLNYKLNERISILSAEFAYTRGDSWKEVKKDLIKERKEDKESARNSINESEELMKTNYPNVKLKVDESKLLE